MTKLWLDDIRPAPEGWAHVYWPMEAYGPLRVGNITHLSLDHDLGDDSRGTGYDVLTWIEEQIVTTGFKPPEHITVHSANSSARIRMELAIKNIKKLDAAYTTMEREGVILMAIHRKDLHKALDNLDRLSNSMSEFRKTSKDHKKVINYSWRGIRKCKKYVKYLIDDLEYEIGDNR